MEAPDRGWDLDAEMIRGRMDVGRTKPIALGARGPGPADSLIDVIIKPAARLFQPPLEYLLEWVGAQVASVLGLRAPASHRVRITREFADAAADMADKTDLLSSLGLVYGAEWVASATPVVGADDLSPERRVRAATILAFDVFVLNVDRRRGNPNLLDVGDDFLCIDHEQAFTFLVPLIGAPPVESDPGEGIVDHHVFRHAFGSRRKPEFGPFLAALADLTDHRLDQVRRSVPSEWTTGPAQGKIEEIMNVLAKRRDAVDQWLPQVHARLCS